MVSTFNARNYCGSKTHASPYQNTRIRNVMQWQNIPEHSDSKKSENYVIQLHIQHFILQVSHSFVNLLLAAAHRPINESVEFNNTGFFRSIFGRRILSL